MNGFLRNVPGILLALSVAGCGSLSGVTLYPFGYIKHRQPTPLSHEGNVEYLAVSKEVKKGNWSFDTGFGSYIDSYGKRSYIAFSDVGHQDFRIGILQPTISLNCQYKGEDYGSDEMRLICSPPLKFRLGRVDGPVLKITPVPKIGTLTNGVISFEFGYKF